MRRFDEVITERLLLRRWRDADREPYAAMNADPRVRRHLPELVDRAGSDASITHFETTFDRNGFGVWALELLETGAFVGFTGLNPMPDDVPGAGGWEVGRRPALETWHQGFATEAGRGALEPALTAPDDGGAGLSVVWSLTAELDEPSIAVMRRLGMAVVARADHPAVEPGHPLRPHVFYRIESPRHHAM